MPEYLTVAQVAARYQVRSGWVTDHASGKRLPRLEGVKCGKYWRFTLADLARFDDHCRAIADQIAKRKKGRAA